MDVIRDLLTGIAGLLTAASSAAASPGLHGDRIAIAACIACIAQQGQGQQYTVSDVSPAVQAFSVRHAQVQQGGVLTVLVHSVEHSQPGAVYLSLGDTELHLGDTRPLILQVAGAKGSQDFVFASGTSLSDISQAISKAEPQTGVHASPPWFTETNFQLVSSCWGPESFVSVAVLDGDLEGATTGVYNSLPDDPWSADLFSRADTATDFGRETVVEINGYSAVVQGRKFSVSAPAIRAEILVNENWSGYGEFAAFRVRRYR